jgi:hypothetical protein
MNGSQTDENQENKIFAKYGYNKKNILMIVIGRIQIAKN